MSTDRDPVADPDSIPITRADPEDDLTVVSVQADKTDEIRLKRLGICAGSRINILASGDPMILGVVKSRVGVSRRLAATILVTPEPICGEETQADVHDQTI